MSAWRLVEDPCLAVDEQGYSCEQDKQGHPGDHVRSEWQDGEIVGPIYWVDRSCAVD